MSIKIPLFRHLLQKREAVHDIGIPIATLIIVTIIFRVTDLDLIFQRAFFVAGEGWVSKDMPVWAFLYDYGPLPGIVMTVAALIVVIASFWLHRLRPYRKIGLFFVLMLVLVPGLIVNGIFKEHWGRPRPRSIQEFGGSFSFHKVWQRGVPGKGHSFPSGHASMGFFLMTPFFVLRKRARRWAIAFLSLGIGYGVLMGIGRMIQGGHFASDVLWSGGFVYFGGLGLSAVLRLQELSVPPFPIPRFQLETSLAHTIGLLMTFYLLEVIMLLSCLQCAGILVYWGYWSIRQRGEYLLKQFRRIAK